MSGHHTSSTFAKAKRNERETKHHDTTGGLTTAVRVRPCRGGEGTLPSFSFLHSFCFSWRHLGNLQQLAAQTWSATCSIYRLFTLKTLFNTYIFLFLSAGGKSKQGCVCVNSCIPHIEHRAAEPGVPGPAAGIKPSSPLSLPRSIACQRARNFTPKHSTSRGEYDMGSQKLNMCDDWFACRH